MQYRFIIYPDEQQKGGRFTTPSNGAKASIQLWIQLSTGWVKYDDVSLRPVETYNLTYDAENHLTGVSGAATASYSYDGDGKRVKATVGGVTTAYIGDYFEWSGSTSTMVKYYYAGTTRVAMRTGSGTGTSGLNWLLSDHLGSTSITANSSGNKVAELRNKAWGETRYTYGTTPTRRQYTGQINEPGIGLYFFNARWYDAALGRWAQPDSIVPVESQGVQAWDRYAFVNNNPIRFTDPSGHYGKDVHYDLTHQVAYDIAIAAADERGYSPQGARDFADNLAFKVGRGDMAADVQNPDGSYNLNYAHDQSVTIPTPFYKTPHWYTTPEAEK